MRVAARLDGSAGAAPPATTVPSSAWLEIANNVTSRLSHALHLNGRP